MPKEKAKSSEKRSRKGKRSGGRRSGNKESQPGAGSSTVLSGGEEIKETMLSEMRASGFDGSHFASTLEVSVEDRSKQGKPPKRNRWIHYCNWAHGRLRREIAGHEDAEFSYPRSVLAFIRHLVPGDVVGELREDGYKVTMTEFCQAMELPSIE